MRIMGCDLHARQQTIAMLDSDTGELEEKTLEHQGETVREFYSALSGPILVGIEATGSAQNVAFDNPSSSESSSSAFSSVICE
jgi:hypothetical protein